MSGPKVKFTVDGPHGEIGVKGFEYGSADDGEVEVRAVHPDQEEKFFFDKKNSVELEFQKKEMKLFREYKGYTNATDPVEFEDCHLPPYVLRAIAMLGWGYR